MSDDILDFDDDDDELLDFGDDLLDFDDGDDLLDFGDDLLDFDDTPPEPKIAPLTVAKGEDITLWPKEAKTLKKAGNDFWHSPHPLYPEGYSQYKAFRWWYKRYTQELAEGKNVTVSKNLAWACLVKLRAGREHHTILCSKAPDWEIEGEVVNFHAAANQVEILFVIKDAGGDAICNEAQSNCGALTRHRAEYFNCATGKSANPNSIFSMELDTDLLG